MNELFAPPFNEDGLIVHPGAYPDVSAEDYHGHEICVRPSVSSSGLKLISAKSPRHYWANSSMNPERPVRKEKAHFAIGKALHRLRHNRNDLGPQVQVKLQAPRDAIVDVVVGEILECHVGIVAER